MARIGPLPDIQPEYGDERDEIPELKQRVRPIWYSQWDVAPTSASFECCGTRYSARDATLLGVMRAVHDRRAHGGER